MLNVTSFCSLYLLLGSLYLFLSLSVRNMFLLLGIVTWLSVRVPRGSFGCLSQVFDRKRGVQSTEAQRTARDREFPMALFPPAHIKALPKFQFVCSEKRHFQGLGVIGDGNIQCANSICRFLAIYPGVPKCCDDQGSNSMSQEVWNISAWSSHQGLKLTELLSQVGALKQYLLGTSMGAQESTFRLHKQKTLLKFFQFICFR